MLAPGCVTARTEPSASSTRMIWELPPRVSRKYSPPPRSQGTLASKPRPDFTSLPTLLLKLCSPPP